MVNRMTNDYISRQAAIDEIDEWIKAFRENGHKESAADACLIQDGIIQLPSVDAAPVRHGFWIEDRYNDLDFVCSECGEPCANMVMGMPRDRYCKWCGARMDGERK